MLKKLADSSSGPHSLSTPAPKGLDATIDKDTPEKLPLPREAVLTDEKEQSSGDVRVESTLTTGEVATESSKSSPKPVRHHLVLEWGGAGSVSPNR